MASICTSCRASYRKLLRSHTFSQTRGHISSPRKEPLDIEALLSKPSWSVRSLFPDPDNLPAGEITPKQLRHLLRLSALPEPKSEEEESEMLKTLHSQLHFVRDIQSVDTEGVEPLQSIRDETEGGISDVTISLQELKSALDKEEIKGRSRRPRRKRPEFVSKNRAENWDVLGTANEKAETPGGTFFVVRSGKAKE